MPRSMRDALREHRAAKGATPVPAAPEAAPTATGSKQQPVGFEPVVAVCGCTIALPLYPEKGDKHRAARRTNLAAKVCRACQEARQQAERTAANERRRARLAARAGQPNWREKAEKSCARLPNGSAFGIIFDAQEKVWRGTLAIGLTTPPLVFEGEAGGALRLLQVLDGKYRT